MDNKATDVEIQKAKDFLWSVLEEHTKLLLLEKANTNSFVEKGLETK